MTAATAGNEEFLLEGIPRHTMPRIIDHDLDVVWQCALGQPSHGGRVSGLLDIILPLCLDGFPLQLNQGFVEGDTSMRRISVVGVGDKLDQHPGKGRI